MAGASQSDLAHATEQAGRQLPAVCSLARELSWKGSGLRGPVDALRNARGFLAAPGYWRRAPGELPQMRWDAGFIAPGRPGPRWKPGFTPDFPDKTPDPSHRTTQD